VLQEGNVGTVDGATAAEGLVPMADSLLERAKQVVDSQFVDEAFVVRRQSVMCCAGGYGYSLCGWWLGSLGNLPHAALFN
jgi:hypothetical protein